MSGGIIQPKVVASHEIVTLYTLGAEEKTQQLLGIPVSRNVTQAQIRLRGAASPAVSQALADQVRLLNRNTARALTALIAFKKRVLEAVLDCRIFTVNYPLNIEHLLREAQWYQQQLGDLEKGQDIGWPALRDTAVFWNRDMTEHAMFIRGMLDPSESALIAAANGFAKDYTKLTAGLGTANERMMEQITRETLEKTKQYRDFKAAGAAGIAACKIRSVILPLLADHVLREANYYVRVLEEFTIHNA